MVTTPSLTIVPRARRYQTAAELYVYLSSQYSPSTQDRKDEIRRRYVALQESPLNQNVLNWLESWFEMDGDLREISILEADEIRHHFQRANELIDDKWSTILLDLHWSTRPFRDMVAATTRRYLELPPSTNVTSARLCHFLGA